MHYASSSQKRKDFWIAFAAWLGTNAVAIAIIQVVSSASGPDNSGTVLGALSFLLVLLNAAALVILAVKRRYAAAWRRRRGRHEPLGGGARGLLLGDQHLCRWL